MEELFYNIDKARSESDNALVIKIQAGERDGLQYKITRQPNSLTQDILNRLATPRDSSILPFLIKEEIAFAKKISSSYQHNKNACFSIVHIPFSRSLEALKLFVTNGKLFFNDKQLVIDLFSKTEFYYFIEAGTNNPRAEGAIGLISSTNQGGDALATFFKAPVNEIKPIAAEGRLKSNSQEIDISSCDFLCKGPPHWYIKGINLRLISTEASWKDLKASYDKLSRSPAELIEEARHDAEAPRVVLKDNAAILYNREPLPLLLLKDRLGAFADLWMDYGNEASLVPFHDNSTRVLNKEGKDLCKRLATIEQGWEKDLLETDFIKKSVDSTHYYCPVDKVAKSIAFLLEIGWQVRDWKGNKVLLHSHVDLHAEMHDQNILVKGKINYGNFQANVSDIVGAFNRRDRFAQIAPGHTALLPNSLEQIGLNVLIEEGEIIGEGIKIKKNRVGSLDALFAQHPKMSLDVPLAEMKEKIESFQSISLALPGEGFTGKLRPYQQEGLNWLAFLYEFGFHGMLADDMGLGKTVQVLAFLSRLDRSRPILIVVPTSLIFNWKREIEKFLPGRQIFINHGSTRQQSSELLNRHDIILTTYTTLRLDFALFSQLSYECVILDEAQAIKNAQTLTSQTVKQLNSRFRLSITGTPIENNLQELWSHFHFLIPDLFGSEESFNAELQAGASDPRFLKRIKKKIRPFLLRRRKEDVAKDLPEKIEQIVWVEMNEEQRRVYEEFLSGVRHNLIKKVNADGIGKHRMEILEAIMRLRQICCHPHLVNVDESHVLTKSSKLEVLMEDIQIVVAEGRKVLVYSQFTSMLALIGKRVKANGWNYTYLDGTTQNREKVVTEFQENPNIPIFLISLKAGGIGLNLTAADYVFLYDPWWNDAVENQAIDRAHRIGRKNTVIAKRYIMMESIEEKMLKLKGAKNLLAADLLDEESGGIHLSSEDLLFLL